MTSTSGQSQVEEAYLPVGVSKAQRGISLQGLPHHSHPIREPVQATSVEAKSTIGHVPLKGEEDDEHVWSKVSCGPS